MTRSQRKTLRVLLLLAVLSGVGFWALGTVRRRSLRTQWERTLEVGVIELAPRGLHLASEDPLASEMGDLGEWFTSQFHRYRGGPSPFHFTVVGPIRVEDLPPLPPAEGDAMVRARYVSRMHDVDELVIKETGESLRRFDLVLYLRVVSDSDGQRFVEGAGAAGGDFGMVQSAEADRGSVLTQEALAHELLHCVGATDKYDEQGHAVAPAGLVDPARGPVQQKAEVMVGEIPQGLGKGALPRSLDEVAVGPVTASEVRWR